MSSSLVLAGGDAVGRAGRWADLLPEERKRRAALAIQTRDLDELWSLTEASLTLYGRAGAQVSPHTLRAYRTGVSALLAAWPHVNLLRPVIDDVALWVRRMEAAGRSTSTVRQRLAAAGALYAALDWANVTDAAPFGKVKPARDPTPAWEKREVYPPADVGRLVAMAGVEDRVMVLLAAHAGLRAAEMLALEWSDVDLSGRKIVVQRGKNRKRRTVPIGTTLLDALTALHGADRSTAYDRSIAAGKAARTVRQRAGVHAATAGSAPDDLSRFVLSVRSDVGARKRLQRLCERAGVRCRALHSLRHSYGTRILRESGRIEYAQRLLGHASIATTQIYSKLADDEVAKTVQDW